MTMKLMNTSKVAPPTSEELGLDSPVSTPGGNFCAPLYIGDSPPVPLGVQFGPIRITGLVQTPRVCYLDLVLNDAQLAWAQSLETTVRAQLPGHKTVWFTRDMQEADVDYFYDTSIHGNKLRARVLRCDVFDTVDLQVFEESGALASIDLVQKEAEAYALVNVQGVSHIQGRLAIDWVVQQVMVKRDAACKIGLGDAKSTEATPASKSEATDRPKATKNSRPAVVSAPSAYNTPLPPPEYPPPPLASSTAEDIRTSAPEITEVDNIQPAGDNIALRPEVELVADELEHIAQEERERRYVALRMFMEANGLDPEAYYLPDTDEEDAMSSDDDEASDDAGA